ncbi:nitroreductase family protein [Aeromonas veronii]|uniref:nitroreductase family protein n=1 Tax=Aeromonas veronii TaxID=654 RepID=UPI003EC515C5
MNQTIDLILSHRSIRQFTAEPIAPQQLDAILAAAQSASTSSFLQVTSIVRVCEPEARQQLAMLAAQSLGLGGVYIGGIRNHPVEVSELLGLPHQVIPLFGLCLGHPAQQPEQKPRLPRGLVVYQERYQHELDRDLLARYDQQIADYYQARSSNNKQQTWSGQIRAILGKESRPFMLGFLQSRGFNLK